MLYEDVKLLWLEIALFSKKALYTQYRKIFITQPKRMVLKA